MYGVVRRRMYSRPRVRASGASNVFKGRRLSSAKVARGSSKIQCPASHVRPKMAIDAHFAALGLAGLAVPNRPIGSMYQGRIRFINRCVSFHNPAWQKARLRCSCLNPLRPRSARSQHCSARSLRGQAAGFVRRPRWHRPRTIRCGRTRARCPAATAQKFRARVAAAFVPAHSARRFAQLQLANSEGHAGSAQPVARSF